MKKTIIKKYARLIARTGANIQKGQPVRIWISADQYDFAAVLVDECYKAGASKVEVEWQSQPLTKLDYRYRSLKSLSCVEQWEEEKLKLMTKELPCRIFIISDDPDGLNGINQEKMHKSKIARYAVTKPYRDAIESLHQWTIAAVPSYKWAKKVFPQLTKNAAYEKLWQSILSAVRVNQDDDASALWQAHNNNLVKRCAWLNEKRFDYLVYKSSNGTDFKCSLIPQAHWCGGAELTKQGVSFNPNLPTEEIFISPLKGKCEGTLVATKPLSYDGQLIENFSVVFKDGCAVSCSAQKGQDLLQKIIDTDEGSKKLGELALIPNTSPISQSGILYYETLFDENASCHVALGEGFNDTIDGYLDKSFDECRALGINDSAIHVDFMIGASDLCITGYKNGVATPVFVNGEWAN